MGSSKRFGTVSLTRLADSVQVSGYYLECVDASGVIIPDPVYHHPNARGEYTANSFNYDLRRLYYLLYKIGDVLAAALQRHVQEVYSVTLPFDSAFHRDGTLLENLFQAVHSLSLASLPNEARNSVPVPRVTGRREYRSLVFDNHKEADNRKQDAAYEVTALLPQPDGFSTKWGLPYFRKSQSPF
jgi:hypothetical protein